MNRPRRQAHDGNTDPRPSTAETDPQAKGAIDPQSNWGAGPHRWVVLDLLDRQIIDSDQHPVGKVDDIDFDDPSGTRPHPRGGPQLVALLSGAEALGQRMGALIGRMMGGTARRMLSEPREGARGVAWGDVAELGYVIGLRAGIAELGLEPALEVWLRDNIIAPIPGSGHARG